MDNIAIVGIGLRFPGNCSNPQEYWENLLKSFDGVIEVPPERWSSTYNQTKAIAPKKCGLIPLDEWKNFDPLFFGISPKDSQPMDPQERMMLMVSYEALDDAQIPSSSLRGSNTGVFVGVSVADYGRSMLQKDSAIDFTPSVLTDIYHNCIIANRVSYCFDLRGPSMSIDTACSSSLVSVDLAIQYIENGTCDVALACGINSILDPNTTTGYTSLGVSGDECLSFDSNAKGFARSEGCGVVVLKRLSDAQRDGNRIYSIIRGRSSNNDGSFGKDTISTPSSTAQSINIEKALKNSNLSASDIYYVEAHATGTVVGDPIEVESISRVFTKKRSIENPMKIGSVKTNIGHLESASGIASLIKVALMLKNRKLVPTIKIKLLNPKIPFEKYNIQVVTQIEDLPSDRSIIMGVNSFGIGGSNCHVILEEYKYSKEERNELNKKFMIPISANSKQSMDKYLNLILNNEELQSKIDFIEFALHQSLSKSHLSNRKMILASDWNEFNSLKYQINQHQSLPLHKELNGNKVIFVFCGQGPQWNQMGFELYQSEPVYRNIANEIDSKLMKYTGYSIIDKIKHLSNPLIDIHKPIYAQPFLFIFQVALFELYKHYGIQPSIVLGHSFGDITAAYCSGNISLDTAIKIVHFRSILQNETIGSGRMLVVGLSSEEYIKSFSNQYNDLEIACFNSPQSIVISGSENELNLLSNELNSKNIFNTFLRTPCSFHSRSQESIKSKIFLNLNDIESNQSTSQWYSSVTGDIKSDGVNSEYIYNNIRDSVQFEKTLESIKRDLGNQIDDHLFIEISPHPTLSNLIKQCIPSSQVISPLQRNKDHFIDFISGISTLFCSGVNLNFQSQFNISNILKNYQWKEKTSLLPRYQWDLNQCWFESSLSKFKRLKGPSISILGNQKIDNGPISYHSDIDIKRPPYQYLKDHFVKNQPILCGTSYVDAIFEAFKSFNQDFQINRIEFKQPMFLKDHPQRIQTYLEKVSNSNYRVKFYFKDADSHDTSTDWILTTEASVSLIPNHFEMKVDVEKLKNQCNLTTMKKQEFYQKTNRVGINYGVSFQHIQLLMFGEKSVFGILKTKPTQNTPMNLLNPTLLDSCFHSLLGLIDERHQIIFESIENIKINWEVVNQIESNMKQFNELYLYSTIMDDSDIYHKNGNCILLTSNGDVIMEVGLFTVGVTERIKMKSIKYPSNSFYKMILQKKDSNFPSPLSFEMNHFIDESSYILNLLSLSKNIIRYLHDSMIKNIPNFSLKSVYEQSCDELIKLWSIHQKKTTIRFFNRIIEIFKENPQCLNEDMLNKNGILEYEFILFSKAIEIIPKVLLGDEEIAHSLFQDNLLDNFYQNSNNLQYFCKQISNLVGSLFTSIVNKQNEKRIIQILEIGGGTGSLTHQMISILDKILENQENIEVIYTFTDISQFFLNSMKDRYENQINLKSNLKLKYLILDIEKDFSSQGFDSGTYDFVLISSVLHIAKDLPFTVENINKVLSPSGWLLFSELTKSFYADLIFGVFSTIWNYEDSIRKDHFTLTPQEWCDLLSESNGFKNTSVSGLVDENGNQLPPNIGFLFFVKTQKLSIDTIIKKKIELNPLIIIDKDQVIKDSSISNNHTIITIDDLFDNQSKYVEFKDLIFIPGVQQLSIDNYQSVTFNLCRLFQIFINNRSQPNIIIITKESQKSNYFANSLLGIVRSSISDYKNLKITFIDIDRDFIYQDIQTIINLSNSYSTLGEYEYFFKNNEIFVERVIDIQKNLLNYSSIVKDSNQLGCKLNLNLEYKLFERSIQLKSKEVEIEVKAVGLNFRDYFYFTNKNIIEFGVDKYHPPYGHEFSGIITNIGNQVKDFKVGDEVVGFSSFSLSSHVISHVDNFIHKPKNISFINSASIPTIFITVYYSLFILSNFDPEKDSILIHSAAGGVGLAALEILKWKKCKKVYVSVGTEEKINYLKSNYSEMILDYFDSKTTEFSVKIKKNSNGVNYIINTLPLDFLEANFKSLAPFGKLIDLITTNISDNGNFDFRCIKNDVQYTPVNLHQPIFHSENNILKPILSIIFSEISKGNINLPKINIFESLETKKALLSFKNRDHIGKKVVDLSGMQENILKPLISSSIDNVKPITKSNFKIESISNSIVIIGQKGISIELIPWFLKYSNVSDIIVLSISPINCRLERLIGMSNNRIHFYQTNISNYQQLEETFKKIIPLYPPIEHIINLALVLEDIPVQDITFENIKKVHGPKVIGTYNLHLITQSFNLQIKQFIVFSSVIGLCGGVQPSYASASLVIDSFCEYRNNVLGLPSKSVILGGIGSEGIIAESKSIRQYVQSIGLNILESSKFLGGFETILQQSKYCKPILSNFDLNYVYKLRGFILKIKHYCLNQIDRNLNIQSDQRNSAIVNEYISKLLSISSTKIEPSTKLKDIGVDSLMSIQLKDYFDSKFERDLFKLNEIPSLTIKSIYNRIENFK